MKQQRQASGLPSSLFSAPAGYRVSTWPSFLSSATIRRQPHNKFSFPILTTKLRSSRLKRGPQCSSVAGDNDKPILKPWARTDDRSEGGFIFDATPLTERP
jgi:hypothetical protein